MQKNPFFTPSFRIVLGSASPRRQELMKSLNLPFEVRIQSSDESFPADLATEIVPLFIANQKKIALLDGLKDDEMLITVDTVVVLDNEIIGKPTNEAEAFLMLKKLSGKRHRVISGVCMYAKHKEVQFSEFTDVYFKALSDEEIAYYIEIYRPLDKAGSYGIQEWLGMMGIHRIEGCFYNVMGLPVSKVYETLKDF